MQAILRRELITLLRTRRAVAAQLGLALAFALLIGLRWPTEAEIGLSGAEASRVLHVFGYGLLTSVLLIVPAFPAVVVWNERIPESAVGPVKARIRAISPPMKVTAGLTLAKPK